MLHLHLALMLKREHKTFKLISRPDEEKGTKNLPSTLSALVPGQATARKPDFQFVKLHQGSSEGELLPRSLPI